MTRPVIASIDNTALQHNLTRVRQLAPEAHVMAIVKADAYGHDLLISSRALKTADSIGLLDLDDAITLRKAGFTQPICLLEGFFEADEIPLIAINKLEPVIHSHWQLDVLESIQDEH
jgi:alanine racemase